MGKTTKELFDEKYGIVNEEGNVGILYDKTVVDEKDLEDEEGLNCQEHLISSWKADEK